MLSLFPLFFDNPAFSSTMVVAKATRLPSKEKTSYSSHPTYKDDGGLVLLDRENDYLAYLLAYICWGLPERRLFGSTWGTPDMGLPWLAQLGSRVQPNPTFIDVVRQDVRHIDDPYVILAAVYLILRLPIGTPAFLEEGFDIEANLQTPHHLHLIGLREPKSLTPSFTPEEEKIRNCLASAENIHLAIYDLALTLGSKSMADMQYKGPVPISPSDQKLFFESQRIALQYFNYNLIIQEDSFTAFLDSLFPFRPVGMHHNLHYYVTAKVLKSGYPRIERTQKTLKSLIPLPATFAKDEDEDLAEKLMAEAADMLFIVPVAPQSEFPEEDKEDDSPATTCTPASVSSITAIKSPKAERELTVTNPDPESPEPLSPTSSVTSDATLATWKRSSVSSSTSSLVDPEVKPSAACSAIVEEVVIAEIKSVSLWDKCMEFLTPLYEFIDFMGNPEDMD